MMAPIYIFAQPVQSGKTTLLMKWLKKKPGVTGILAPDVKGRRMIYDISKNSYHEHQITSNAFQDSVNIGKFTFSKMSFELAGTILLGAMESNPSWLIIDEVGKLEIFHHQGLEPALSEIIHTCKTENNKTSLILVIRDSLLDKAISHYKISNFELIGSEFFNETKPA